ncbi:hypothetical protein A3C20_04935 [Candidatus Kaiserbacteria bacterium RIFCSPHIGHO2_02_FULL_55_25]|uniref:Uncharacterized protein n=1 Tax=Candidatus Kaiserbacteria bacterium RIFCSPHIGHO2_02_FULL_55_25 TaxID=1798498 RepID=A0A1F6E5T5_9BACT|nr:MAG: hypothetical protein A3C20_04935 [Candidatus Kaiserbacteria bacterium RIFCSPHIGHO2_02_FULL_55_25]OGG76994.1 MAG: hypothetical protein A3F56_01805 [Candidatus Kaiserbacteria bacterium RIFCSPHIGHO2_12_FULL_55_13]
MAFAWERQTPEGHLGRREKYDRSRASLETLAQEYGKQAREMLNAEAYVRDEVARFAKGVTEPRGDNEKDAELDKLMNALRVRKASVFTDIPDDVREQKAFTLALARVHMQSLH